MTKLLSALVAALFALGTLSPAFAGEAKKDEKPAAEKKGDAKKSDEKKSEKAK